MRLAHRHVVAISRPTTDAPINKSSGRFREVGLAHWIQPFVNVYSEFKRSDGHVLWMHDDQWEGQNWAPLRETFTVRRRECISIRRPRPS